MQSEVRGRSIESDQNQLICYFQQEQVPQKRAALVLDRLLIALQKALHEEGNGASYEADKEGPRTAPLRLADEDVADMVRHRPHKRPALVIDQLLMAIQKALQARNAPVEALQVEEPRAVPVISDEDFDMVRHFSSFNNIK